MIVNFKQPIVDDKSDGYNVVNGKKKIKLDSLPIHKGGRGKSAKKKHRI